MTQERRADVGESTARIGAVNVDAFVALAERHKEEMNATGTLARVVLTLCDPDIFEIRRVGTTMTTMAPSYDRTTMNKPSYRMPWYENFSERYVAPIICAIIGHRSKQKMYDTVCSRCWKVLDR